MGIGRPEGKALVKNIYLFHPDIRLVDFVKVGGMMSVVYLAVMLGAVNALWWAQALIAR